MSAANLDTFRPKERAEWISKLDKINAAEEQGFVVSYGDIANRGLMQPYLKLFLEYNNLFGDFYAFQDITNTFTYNIKWGEKIWKK